MWLQAKLKVEIWQLGMELYKISGPAIIYANIYTGKTA